MPRNTSGSTRNTDDARTTKDERELLLFSLFNPMHEDACCAIGLNKLLHKALSKNPEDDPRQGPILRAVMAFLSAERTEEEHDALLQRLKNCHCKPATIRLSHSPVFRPLTEVLELVLFFICGTIGDYFMRLGAGKFRKERENVAPDAQPWPSRVSDIIPNPTEHALLSALVQWAATVPGGHSVFSLIGAIARFWEPFALELFHSPGVFHLATQHMRCALDGYDRRANEAEQMNSFVTPIIACAQGLFYTCFEIDMSITVGILHPIYEQMYAIADPIEPILLRMKKTGPDAFQMDDCRRWFSFVRMIRPVFNADGTFNTNIPLPEYSDPTKNGGRVYFVGAFLRMVEIRNRNQCLHITCESKIQARSSICGRCGIVRFCSSECLTAAWTSPTHPHKMLCKQIQNLRAQSCLVDPHAWNRTIRDSSIHRDPEPFATACLATTADPNLAQAIVMGITYLTRERLNFLDKQKERIEADVDVGVSIPDQEGRLVESAPADFRGAGEGEVADAADPLPEEEVD